MSKEIIKAQDEYLMRESLLKLREGINIQLKTNNTLEPEKVWKITFLAELLLEEIKF